MFDVTALVDAKTVEDGLSYASNAWNVLNFKSLNKS